MTDHDEQPKLDLLNVRAIVSVRVTHDAFSNDWQVDALLTSGTLATISGQLSKEEALIGVNDVAHGMTLEGLPMLQFNERLFVAANYIVRMAVDCRPNGEWFVYAEDVTGHENTYMEGDYNECNLALMLLSETLVQEGRRQVSRSKGKQARDLPRRNKNA